MECRNKKTLNVLLEKIMKDKGEGIMLRRPASIYEHGRSSSLLKIKASRADSEALVIETNPDFVIVKLPGGETLQVKDVAVESKRGDIVTIEYDNITRHAVPVCPKLIRIRSDLSWAHVVGDFTRDSLLKAESSTSYGGEKGKITKDKRRLFENFAKSRNMDPLDPATWYSVSRQFLENQGMKGSVFRGGYSKVLQRLFPDLLFDLSLFPSVPRGYWADPANRKRFFDEFAFQNEFDPLLPQNWYSITDQKIRSVKSTGILKKYGGSFTQALMHVYPDIGLNRFNFSFLPSGYWSDKKNRKKFFDDFAQENDFDPLVAEHWYSITKQSLISHKGSATVLSYYNGSYKKALLDVYPDIGLDSEKFTFFDRGHWGDAKNRRKFFDTFASDRNFDPLVAENWYTITTKDIEETKYGRAVMYYYGWSVAKALSDLYPSISFDSQYFFKPSGFWTKENNRKTFFDTFAKLHGFDPLVASNWYSISSHQINSTHNSGSVLRYYSGGYVKALMQIYPTIGLHEKMFSIPSGYWNVMENRKLFFDEFAKDHQFDPLVHHNWYSITPKQLRSYKNGSGVLKSYSGSYVKALLDVYPDIGLQRDKFVTVESGFWGEEKNRKEFFDAFAKTNNFDALIPTNWYTVSRHKLISTKNSGSVLRYYNGSFVNALEDLYPALHLDRHSFTQLR